MRRAWGLAALLIVCLAAGAAEAQDRARPRPTRPADAPRPFQPSDAPAILSADTVTVDRELGLVTATGKVEITQGERVLLADTVTYNNRTGAATASGNVALMEPSGDVMFAEYAELESGFKAGVIRTFRLLMADGSRLAANQATRGEDGVAELSRGVYTPCQSCEGREPLWQIKAIRVVHDAPRQQVRYQDAFLEAWGVPIAYVPFFAHPDPTVKRASGFLAPNFGSSSDLGLTAETPYFWAIDGSKDLTLAPTFTTKEGVIAAAEYRQRTASGAFQLDGSFTRTDQRDLNGERTGRTVNRGHVRGDGRFDLDSTWRTGFDVFRATDDTYLRRYRIKDKRKLYESNFGRETPSEAPFGRDTLTSDVFLEGFRGRNYAAMSAYAFQGLKIDDDPGKTPLVAPFLEYAHVGEPNSIGARFQMNALGYALYRTEGTDARRVSIDGGWQLPYIAPGGDIFTLTANVRGDVYWVNGLDVPGSLNGDSVSGVTGRLVPSLAAEWRYPLVRSDDYVRQVIEPVVLGAISPYGGNKASIPNEDAISFELDETNLFSLDRFPGRDRVETGPHATVGLRYAAYGPTGGSSSVLIGQSFRMRDDSTFGTGSGLEGSRSDYVARITVNPTDTISFTQRLRFDRQDFNLDRNEIYLYAGDRPLLFSLGYVALDRAQFLSGRSDREEVYVAGRVWLTDVWRVQASYRRDLSDGGGPLSARAALIYEDECFLLSSEFNRDFTRDRDIKPSTSIHFRVRLLHLG
jgi:LPS-assembly protein